MSSSVKPLDKPDHQYTREENLQQPDAHLTLTTLTSSQQPLDPAVYAQWHQQQIAYFLQRSPSGIALSWFTELMKHTKLIRLHIFRLPNNSVRPRKLYTTHKSKYKLYMKKRIKKKSTKST